MGQAVIGKQSTVKEPVNIWNRTFISVFLTNGMMYLGQQMVQPLITSYAKTLGATETVIGLVASAFTITAILLKVISAPAIDTYNKKYLLCGAMCIMGTAYLGFAFAGTVPVWTGIYYFLLSGIGHRCTAAEETGTGNWCFCVGSICLSGNRPDFGEVYPEYIRIRNNIFDGGGVYVFRCLLCFVDPEPL